MLVGFFNACAEKNVKNEGGLRKTEFFLPSNRTRWISKILKEL
jgi:hypothetical protein